MAPDLIITGARSSPSPAVPRKTNTPVRPRTVCLLTVNLCTACAAQLLKLGVERLPIGAEAGIAKAAGLRFTFGHILGKP